MKGVTYMLLYIILYFLHFRVMVLHGCIFSQTWPGTLTFLLTVTLIC